MKYTEYEGKTIDDAIRQACEKLQAAREQLHIEIISGGTSGFFGLGSKKARIRAAYLDPERDRTDAGTFSLSPETLAMPSAPSVVNATKTASDKVPGTEKALSEKAREILVGILERMSMPCPVTVEENEDRIVLNIKGDGGGLLIGKRGKNLDALQYIVSKAVNRQGSSKKMIVIDTETYRQRREESLVALALELGEKAKKTQKPITVSHMNPHNRRIIHMALQNVDGLTTKSRGEGEFRKILILPNSTNKTT